MVRPNDDQMPGSVGPSQWEQMSEREQRRLMQARKEMLAQFTTDIGEQMEVLANKLMVALEADAHVLVTRQETYLCVLALREIGQRTRLKAWGAPSVL